MTSKKWHAKPQAHRQTLAMLRCLQSDTFNYFLNNWNSKNGLVCDQTKKGSPSSMAANGLALSCYVVGVERNLMSRSEAIERTLKMLKFFKDSEQSDRPTASGYKGFYYHFLDMRTGRRDRGSELSTIDTALFFAGALSSAEFFSGSEKKEKEIRTLVEKLYRRVDWRWALNGKNTLVMKWSPEEGFSKERWDSEYNEAMILYALALGSPTHAISPLGYREWTRTFRWRRAYGYNYIHAGPLFIHQLSHVWIDFRGIRDEVGRKYDLDYFENSRRATHVQRRYAIANPRGFDRYGENFWGISSSQGPGPCKRRVRNVTREFYGYIARGAPDGPDDGTVSPWATTSSLPFAPKVVSESIHHMIDLFKLSRRGPNGLEHSFNPTFPDRQKNPYGWVAPHQMGLDQGPVILMIENHFSQMLWKLMHSCGPLRRGLQRAGFRGAWLSKKKT